MNKIKAVKNPNDVCFKCLGRFPDNKLNIIHISSLGYGSGFDGWSTEIHLCEDCIKETNQEWWELEIIREEYCEEYKYESEIFNFVRTLPLEGRELFWNRFSEGWNDYPMEAQDWIDYELNILPHERCKQYGMYSYQEKIAYQERFPICDKVRIVEYSDTSKGSRCPFGAFGNKDGTAEGHQTQSQCYQCVMFDIKGEDEEIPVIDNEDFEIYGLQSKLSLKMLIKSLKQKTKN